VTHSAAAGEGKKIDDGTMKPPLNSKSDPVTVADPREPQSLTPAATKETSDIQINSGNSF
jgi:hypothetical protein